MKTLAILANHLLLSLRTANAMHSRLTVVSDEYKGMLDQRSALMRFARQLGSAEAKAMHCVAHALPSALHCTHTALWLITTTPMEQRLVTYLPGKDKESLGSTTEGAAGANDNADNGGGGGSSSAEAYGGLGRQFDMPMPSAGILGHVLATVTDSDGTNTLR